MSKLYIHRVSLLLLNNENENLIELHSLMKKNNIKIKPIFTYDSMYMYKSIKPTR